MAISAQFFLLMEAKMPQARSLARYARGTLHDTPGENMKKLKSTVLISTPVPHTTHLLSSFLGSDTTSSLPDTLRPLFM